MSIDSSCNFVPPVRFVPLCAKFEVRDENVFKQAFRDILSFDYETCDATRLFQMCKLGVTYLHCLICIPVLKNTLVTAGIDSSQYASPFIPSNLAVKCLKRVKTYQSAPLTEPSLDNATGSPRAEDLITASSLLYGMLPTRDVRGLPRFLRNTANSPLATVWASANKVARLYRVITKPFLYQQPGTTSNAEDLVKEVKRLIPRDWLIRLAIGFLLVVGVIREKQENRHYSLCDDEFDPIGAVMKEYGALYPSAVRPGNAITNPIDPETAGKLLYYIYYMHNEPVREQASNWFFSSSFIA